MYNPSYLVKSRHDVYYFRYPLPIKALGKEKRISISLKTRCPREALRLAKILEYHGLALTEELDYRTMDHAEIAAIFKDHFAKILHAKKVTMDELGPLPKAEVSGRTSARRRESHSATARYVLFQSKAQPRRQIKDWRRQNRNRRKSFCGRTTNAIRYS